MKLERAIKTLTFESKYPGNLPASELRDAVKLLIEAGKKIKLCRDYECSAAPVSLPGETKD